MDVLDSGQGLAAAAFRRCVCGWRVVAAAAVVTLEPGLAEDGGYVPCKALVQSAEFLDRAPRDPPGAKSPEKLGRVMVVACAGGVRWMESISRPARAYAVGSAPGACGPLCRRL